jgi:hypothetical protein
VAGTNSRGGAGILIWNWMGSGDGWLAPFDGAEWIRWLAPIRGGAGILIWNWMGSGDGWLAPFDGAALIALD